MKGDRPLPEPERWSDRAARGASAEDSAGAALKRVRQATEPTDAAVARVALRSEGTRRANAAPLIWRTALAIALVVVMGGVVGAALKKWRHSVSAAHPEPATPAFSRSPGRAPGVHRTRVAATMGEPRLASDEVTIDTKAALVAAPAVGPDVVSPPRTEGAPPSSRAAKADRPPPASPATPPAIPPTPLSEADVLATEAGLLASAFRHLRSGGEADSALRSLDEYDRRFPDGALRIESRIARAEALMLSGRRADALPLLEGIEHAGGAVTRDVRISRAELLADTGRCSAALHDFDAVLADAEGDSAGGRALYGRAACHLAAGDVATARRDLKRYLSLHPAGNFASAARHAVDRLP